MFITPRFCIYKSIRQFTSTDSFLRLLAVTHHLYHRLSSPNFYRPRRFAHQTRSKGFISTILPSPPYLFQSPAIRFRTASPFSTTGRGIFYYMSHFSAKLTWSMNLLIFSLLLQLRHRLAHSHSPFASLINQNLHYRVYR